MERDEEAQASQPDAISLTVEQMSIKHIHARFGVVKGIGMRPSSSIRTTTTSTHGSNEEVVRLEQKMEEERQLMENKMEEQQQQLEAQSIQINTMMEYLKKMGYNGPPPPHDDGSSGCGLTAA